MAILAVADTFGDVIYTFDITGLADNSRATAIKQFLLPSNLLTPYSMAYLTNDIVILADNHGDEAFVFNIETVADGARVAHTKRINLPAGQDNPHGMAYLGDDIIAIVDSGTGQLYTFNLANTANNGTAAALKTINLPSNIQAPEGMTHFGDGVVAVIDNNGDEVFTFNAETTANGATATIIKRITLPTGANNPAAITYLGDDIFAVADLSDRALYTFNLASTANGQRASKIRRINFPSRVRSAEAMVALVEPPIEIESISSPLSIVVDTPWSLSVNITGDPDKVEVVGRLYGVDHEWNNPTLRIFNTFMHLEDGYFTIKASRGSAVSEEVEVEFSVVPSPPIIPNITLPSIIKNDEYWAYIPIANRPGELVAEGLWAGLSQESHSDEIAKTEGIVISGDIGAGPYGVNETEFTVSATNDAATVTRTFTQAVEDISYQNLLIFSSAGRTTAIDKDTGSGQSASYVMTPTAAYSFTLPALEEGNIRQISDAAIWENNILMFSRPNTIDIFSKSASGMNRLRKTFSVDIESRDLHRIRNQEFTLLNSLDVHDDTLYIMLEGSTSGSNLYIYVYTYDLSNGIADNQLLEGDDFVFWGGGLPADTFKINIDDTYLYAFELRNNARDRIWRYLRTNRNSAGSVQLEVNQNIVSGFAVDDDNIYYNNGLNREVRIYRKTDISWSGNRISTSQGRWDISGIGAYNITI